MSPYILVILSIYLASATLDIAQAKEINFPVNKLGLYSQKYSSCTSQTLTNKSCSLKFDWLLITPYHANGPKVQFHFNRSTDLNCATRFEEHSYWEGRELKLTAHDSSYKQECEMSLLFRSNQVILRDRDDKCAKLLCTPGLRLNGVSLPFRSNFW